MEEGTHSDEGRISVIKYQVMVFPEQIRTGRILFVGFENYSRIPVRFQFYVLVGGEYAA